MQLFRELVSNESFLKAKDISTKGFWLENRNKFPNLAKLANILLNIPSSSAFIERFFSICGVVCKQRSMAMTDLLIITRALLKTNIHLLKEINETSQ